ncbi:leucine-rich repeat-containing protein [Heterostelium album PN500]|uniref:protein-tyrosine-phosphatase n=1 Tax=Heterostelium pallidum (strain ATCC 26659 / Pp 5 / PN500) TaxID=670386 RepID=D3BCH6_HETP5|nr:leucine-rich repeat-containing protein [Heterostelium album PN500]EFA80966.1 leucine-rich repeat-containing protein [Heterostelium album PN500]|eukprot:XP_020433084.1 leucine-rich repeat-containing protein [Heterostelium album PN500]
MIKKIFSIRSSRNGTSKGDTLLQEHQSKEHLNVVPVSEYQNGATYYVSIHSKLSEIPLFLFVGGDLAPPALLAKQSSANTLSSSISNSPRVGDGTSNNGANTLSISNGGSTASASPKLDRAKKTTPVNTSNGSIDTTTKLYYNPNLTKLILDFNIITSVPNIITLLPNLVELSLASNLISELPDCLTELKSLQTLHLGFNTFMIFPKVVYEIKSLTALHYESNELQVVSQELLKLNNLNTLSLVGNRFKATPEFLPVGLDKLNLSANDITTIIPNSVFLSVLTTLTLLNLAENQLTKIDDSFVLLSSVKTLLLDCNMIGNLSGSIVKGWKSLETLSMPHNELTTLPPEIAFLPDLRVIDVRGNRFSHTKNVSPEVSSSNTFQLLDFISDKESYDLLKVTFDLNNSLLEMEIQAKNHYEDSGQEKPIKTENGKEHRPFIIWQGTYPDKIIDGVYLGCRECSINKQFLRENNITHILTIANLKPLYPSLFKYKVINIEDVDYENISMYFNETNEFIDDARDNGGAVLIHCRAGISRSASATIAFIMYKNNLSYEEAYQITEKGRPRICPNMGFRKQLKDYETLLKKPK